MRKVLVIILGFAVFVAAGWKIAEFRAAREADEKRQQLAEERQREEARQQEILRQREAKRLAYVDLISKAAFGHLWATQRTALDTVDFAEQKQRLSVIYQAQPGDLLGSRLVSVWGDVHRYAEHGLLILYRIDSLQQTQPSGWEVIHSVQKESKLTAEIDKAQLQSEFRETEANLNHSIGDLARAISDLSLPDCGETLKVGYLPAWRGVFAGETLQMQNTSAIDWQRALVFVTITSKTGATLTHLHYADRWAPDSSLTGQYIYAAGDYLNSESLDQPETVAVLAVTQSGLNRGIYRLTPDEWDTRVKGYLSKVTFQGAYLGPYIEQETGNHFGPGFQFSFTGLRSLPVRAARVRFNKGGQFEDTAWNLSSIEPGKTYPVRSNLTSQPDGAELTLWFQDTSVTVTIPSGAPSRITQEPPPTTPLNY